MPKTTTLHLATKPQPIGDEPDGIHGGKAPPAPKAAKRVGITHVQFARLANAIAAMDTSDYDSIPSLAAHLTVELGFPVMTSPVRDALDMHGKTTKVQAQRIAAKLKPKGKQAALAAAIAHLYTKLGEELPAELKEML